MKYDNTKLTEAVKVSTNWAEVYRNLTGKQGGSAGMQHYFSKRAKKLGLDTSHFNFQRKPKAVAAVEPAVAPIDPATAPTV